MKKSVINSILEEDTKRKGKIVSLICLLVIVFVISLAFALIYVDKSKVQYVTYGEDSNIDYNVYLKENEFYSQEYVGKDNQYIASLIDYISTNFNYKISLDSNDVEYRYSYKIDAEVNVIDSKSKKSLYKVTDNLIKEQEKTSTKKDVEISQKLDIDYNKYNDLIKSFVNIYGINETQSTLTINMYVNVAGKCEKFEDENNNPSVLSLVIPLTEKTIGLDITNNLVKSKNNVMVCEEPTSFVILYLFISLGVVGIGVSILAYLVNFVKKTRSPGNIYQKEIKKILNNYGSYIQKVENSFEFESYKLLKIENFTDMLEIRDTLMQPILMIEDKKGVSTYFIIPSNTKLLYVYRLNVNDIKKQINKNVEVDTEFADL